MNLNELTLQICALEKKQHNLSANQVKETVTIISDLIAYKPEVLIFLLQTGQRRIAAKTLPKPTPEPLTAVPHRDTQHAN